MNKSILITLPRYDDVTEYLCQFSHPIIIEAEKRGISVKKLSDSLVNRQEFEKVLSKLNQKFVIFNGHGELGSIFGHRNSLLIKKGVNDEILKGRIIYSRSCESASLFDSFYSDSKEEGCLIGYEFPFMFYIDLKWSVNPLKDKVAELFFEPSNIIPISLIKGNTAKEAHEKSKKQILKILIRF